MELRITLNGYNTCFTQDKQEEHSHCWKILEEIFRKPLVGLYGSLTEWASAYYCDETVEQWMDSHKTDSLRATVVLGDKLRKRSPSYVMLVGMDRSNTKRIRCRCAKVSNSVAHENSLDFDNVEIHGPSWEGDSSKYDKDVVLIGDQTFDATPIHSVDLIEEVKRAELLRNENEDERRYERLDRERRSEDDDDDGGIEYDCRPIKLVYIDDVPVKVV